MDLMQQTMKVSVDFLTQMAGAYRKDASELPDPLTTRPMTQIEIAEERAKALEFCAQKLREIAEI